MQVGHPTSLLKLVRALHHGHGWPLEQVLPLLTRNPAHVLKLRGKGRLQVGADADLLALDTATLEVTHVVARGVLVATPQWVAGGIFERGEGIKPYKPPG